MRKHTPEKLIEKYSRGTCSEEEKAIVESWHLKDLEESKYVLSEETINKVNKRMRKVITTHALNSNISYRLWPRIAAAATIVLFLSFGGYFLLTKKQYQVITQKQAPEITPGGNKAVLILGNGKRIVLTDAENGKLAEQSGVKITKSADGQLVYSVSDSKVETSKSEIIYNSVETPRGGQYKVQLPDGTEVWLNASSSLKFPTGFGKLKERRVELKGEAYFEVSPNKTVPFVVEAMGQEVTVLGTHFNISSYADEAVVRTTLLEGSVRIVLSENYLNKGHLVNPVILKPGQQSSLIGNSFNVKSVVAEDAIAWKNGFLMFNNESLESVMTKVSRWYKIDVQYDDPSIKTLTFFGTISKFENISKVLNMLERTGVVKFKIDKSTIKISRPD